MTWSRRGRILYAALAFAMLSASSAMAADIAVLSPRAGTYRVGQEIQVSWKQPPSRTEPVLIQLVGRKGRPVYRLGRVLPTQRRLVVRVPKEVAAGSYSIRVVQGAHRGSSGTLQVTRRPGPAPDSGSGTASFVTASLRPEGNYHGGQAIEIVLSSGRTADRRALTVRLWPRAEGRPPQVLARGIRSTDGVIPTTIPVGTPMGRYWITVHEDGARNPLARTEVFAVVRRSAGPVLPPGRSEHEILTAELLDEHRERFPSMDGADLVEANLTRGRRVYLRVQVARYGPRQPVERCRPGLSVRYEWSHQRGQFNDQGGRIFPLREVSSDGEGGRLEAEIPFEISARLPLGTEMSGVVRLARVHHPACDQGVENNTASFRLRVTDAALGEVDLEMRLTAFRLSHRGDRYHMRATIRLKANGAGARRVNVPIRWSFKGRRPGETEWIPLEGHDTQGQVTVLDVSGDAPVYKTIHAYMSKGGPNAWNSLCPFHEGVHGHLGIVADPDRVLEDTVRGNNSVSRTWN